MSSRDYARGSNSNLSLGGSAPAYPVTDLVADLVAHGAAFARPLEVDGKVHRCATVTRPRKKNFSYLLYPDGCGGWYENHETGEGPQRLYLAPGRKAEATTDQRAQWATQRSERAAMARKARVEARARARAICSQAHPALPDHPYLEKKQIKPYELLQRGVELVAPIVSVEGDVQTIERISPRGEKKFLPGGAVAGNFYALGEVWTGRRLLICEGVATAHTLFESTGLPTVAAMFAGNLEPVTRVISKMDRQCKILICADDDWKTKGNPGLTAATKAASVVDGRVVIPDFIDLKRGDKDTDFNDLQLLTGLHEVRRQIIWAL